ncbi:hypothetical protein HYW20_01145 [Candidatus Woesearchaeota archaeon]|nr:hypothetical protein [Candidatus Woesearchaeota archaeon]
MEPLEKIFGNEWEVKIAQELLKTLYDLNRNPAVAISLTEKLQQDRALIELKKTTKQKKIDYMDMFERLIKNDYIKVRGLTPTECM